MKVISVSGRHPCKHSSKKKQIALSSEQQQLIERFCKALVPSIWTNMSSWTQLATKTPTGASSYEASHAHAPPTHQAWGWIPQLGSQPQTIGCPRMHPKLMELHSNAAGACRQPQVGELCTVTFFDYVLCDQSTMSDCSFRLRKQLPVQQDWSQHQWESLLLQRGVHQKGWLHVA